MSSRDLLLPNRALEMISADLQRRLDAVNRRIGWVSTPTSSRVASTSITVRDADAFPPLVDQTELVSIAGLAPGKWLLLGYASLWFEGSTGTGVEFGLRIIDGGGSEVNLAREAVEFTFADEIYRFSMNTVGAIETTTASEPALYGFVGSPGTTGSGTFTGGALNAVLIAVPN